MKNKIHELQYSLAVNNPDIVCITETWLHSSTPNCVIVGDTNFSIYRKDRPVNHEGGGVCILINNASVQAVPIDLPTKYYALELVAVDIINQESHTPSFRLFVAYRPPSCSETDPSSLYYISQLCGCIESLYPLNSTVVLCGDFNFPRINWSNNNNVLTNEHTCSGVFIKFFYKHALTQLVNSPTRFSSQSLTGSLLDLVFCNDHHFVFNTSVSAPFGSSDHATVGFNVIRSLESQKYNKCSFDFKRADWVGLSSFFDSIDFFNLFESCTGSESILVAFYTVIHNGLTQFVPVLSSSMRFNCKKKMYPYKIRKTLNRKSRQWSIYRRLRTPESLHRYKVIAAECRTAIYEFHVELENRIINSENLGKFFNYANRKFNCTSAIGPLRSTDGSLSTDPCEKTELFQSVFSSAYTHDNGYIPPLSTNTNNSTKLSSIIFTPTLVKRVIGRIKGKSKGGPDNIPPQFFKQCINQLASPLAFIFNKCMDTNYIPPVWLQAYITPIFKKGDPTDPQNYRPIALTCTICKIMETVIKDQILDYLLSKKLISKHQHGFMRNHSTTTNLLESTHDWIVGLSSSNNIDVVYIDFSKAFDSIVFSKLVCKLQTYGICGKLLAWLSGFIHGRSQCVVLENYLSTVADVISGVPQGSVLGPILFLVFINDVISIRCGDTTVKLFADDLKLYSVYNTTDNSADLQQSIDKLVNWSKLWQLEINLNKCHVLSINTKSKSNIGSRYSLNGFPLSNVTIASDLGVSVDSNLSFKHHISTVITKALQRSGVFFRGFASRSLDIVRKTFITYIRPILEYNSNVWNPSHKYLVDQLENVQRRFTKRVKSLSHLSYLERLSFLELEPLELRRLRFDLVQFYKILNNLTLFDPADYFTVHQPSLSSRAPSSFLIKPINRPNYVLSSFFYRSIDCWNSLPLNLKQSKSLAIFKHSLLSVDLNVFLKGSAFNIS